MTDEEKAREFCNSIGIDYDLIRSEEYQAEIKKREIAEAKAEAERKSRYKQERYEKSGVNKRYWNESIETFKPETEEDEKNLHLVKSFIAGKGRQMLLLIGTYGTGKTHLGASIIRECGGRFISSFEFCTRFEMGSDYKAEKNKLQVLEEFSDYSMLVIDEIGRGTQSEKILLPYLINQFYEKENRLVLITNLEKEDFIKLVGEATTDRLKEVCSTLTFTGKSKRGEKNGN